MGQCRNCIHSDVCMAYFQDIFNRESNIFNSETSNVECDNYKDKENIRPIIKAIWERRGVKSTNSPNKQFFCSNCGGMVELAHYSFTCYYRYCPSCGAKMEDEDCDFDYGTKRTI